MPAWSRVLDVGVGTFRKIASQFASLAKSKARACKPYACKPYTKYDEYTAHSIIYIDTIHYIHLHMKSRPQKPMKTTTLPTQSIRDCASVWTCVFYVVYRKCAHIFSVYLGITQLCKCRANTLPTSARIERIYASITNLHRGTARNIYINKQGALVRNSVHFFNVVLVKVHPTDLSTSYK